MRILQLTGSSATALPGLIILRLYPRFLEETIGKHPEKIILITGTNGKTTTAHLLTHLLRKSGQRVFHNPEGSNMERGIVSEILKKNKLNFDYFVIEADEGTFPNLLQKLKPRAVILLNIFRDQLDRYGEINTLMNKWSLGLQNNPPQRIIFNSDDPNITFIVSKHQNSFDYPACQSPDGDSRMAGRSNDQMNGFSVEQSNENLAMKSADRVFCPQCNNILKFTENNFYCENCGFKKMKPEYVLKENSKLEFNGESIGMPIVGKYNFYNLAAALAAFDICRGAVPAPQGGGTPPLQKLLEGFQPAFGRFEKITYKNHFFHVILAKNPAGMDNVLITLQRSMQPTNLMMCLNDKVADGEDVSWIYDVDFENLFFSLPRLVLSGTRAYDLALRLKIAEKLPEAHTIEPDMQTVFENFLIGVEKSKVSTIIVTYTCLLELQKIMFKKGMIKKIM